MQGLDAIRKAQPHIVDFLVSSHVKNRLVHAYIFEGGSEQNKFRMAKAFAKMLLCESEDKICSTCHACYNISNDQSESVIVVRPDGKSIKKDDIVELKSEMTKTSASKRAKIYVIDQAEKMTTSAANSLLKFLEEPAPDHYILMLTKSKENLLSTIVSRAVALSFVDAADDVAECDEGLLAILIEIERGTQIPSVVLATRQKVLKEPGAMLALLELYQRFYRDIIDRILNRDVPNDWDGFLDEVARRFALSECLKRTQAILEAKKRLDFNANAMLVMEWLFDEFGRC